MALLEADKVNVFYGNIHAIKDVSFEVNEGEIVTLIGANGAGKTTTLNTVSGLLKPRSGAITFNGENLAHVPAHHTVAKGMALCPEGRRVFLNMSVRENLEMGAFVRKDNQVGETLEMVYERFPRLKEREGQSAGTLSGGEQQRVSVARAMVNRPPLLICDEPTGNLDPAISLGIMKLLERINRTGTTILMATHDREMVDSMRKRVIALEGGHVVRDQERGGYSYYGAI